MVAGGSAADDPAQVPSQQAFRLDWTCCGASILTVGARGEVICIIGPSGSGKSTLLRCINHLEVPERGVIRIDGEVVYRERVDGGLRGRTPSGESRRCAPRSAWCSSSSTCSRT